MRKVMTTTIPARTINLRFLIEEFGLQRVQDSSQFFTEWQEQLPEITDLEKQLLDQVQQGFINLLDYPHLHLLVYSNILHPF
jgi:ABC-type uncharacterized transport system permease subunit